MVNGGRPREVVVHHPVQPGPRGDPDLVERGVEAGDARLSISSCSPLPLCRRTTDDSSPYAVEKVGGPPSASPQYAASRSVWCGSTPW